ncbi:hypothetical protein ACFSDD_10960 [Salipiger marinus]|uniref:hypothetical protein n=1 Tax=Salipiger marinus TaxID=555512 RepID=UPI002C5DFB32|nr:hypothetical protein [Salipiger manganoxidans]MEB3419890.1 hypothetical protein [Salipiger manganoxidans]
MKKIAWAVQIADLAIQLRSAEIVAANESQMLTDAYRDFRRMNGLESIAEGTPEYDRMMQATKGEYDAKVKARAAMYSIRRKLRAAIDRHQREIGAA